MTYLIQIYDFKCVLILLLAAVVREFAQIDEFVKFISDVRKPFITAVVHCILDG